MSAEHIQVIATIALAGFSFLTLLVTTWQTILKRRWEVEDRNWKAVQEERSNVAKREREAILQEVQVNTEVSLEGASASKGEPKHAIMADVHRRLDAERAAYPERQTDAPPQAGDAQRRATPRE